MTNMHVEYMTHSGDDILVLNAARASFGKETEWERQHWDPATGIEDVDLREMSERDNKLLNFLAREKHMLPFRHPQITLRCRAPIFVARQVGKHQTGMSWSEESRRYITTEPEFFWPDKWRKAAENVKQGSSDESVEQVYSNSPLTPQYLAEYVQTKAVDAYTSLLSAGVAPELARMILPQNMMCTWVWTGSLLAFFHMYKERSHPTAQKETRYFAELVREVVEPLYPYSWKVLTDAS